MIYRRFILPRLVHFACGLRPATRQRARTVPAASGVVLEIGFGSGLNLPFYDPAKVSRVWALDPSNQMWHLARERVRRARFPVDFLEARAEDVPLPDRSVDTVVVTYALCTVPGVLDALGEARRVLAPSGRLIFSEHGAAPDEKTRRWQRRLNPIWKPLSGGCHLDRPIPSLLEQGGFRLDELSVEYVSAWKPASYTYWGTATPA
jgi:ubiquinone/menaquinone biosynthesis C-methylase UbiE